MYIHTFECMIQLVDAERIRPGHWLELMLWVVFFSALTLLVGWREGQPYCKNRAIYRTVKKVDENRGWPGQPRDGGGTAWCDIVSLISIRPPTDSTSLKQSPKKLLQVIYVGDPYSCAKLGAHTYTGAGAPGQMGEI